MVDLTPAEGWDLSSKQWDVDQKMRLHHLDGIFYGIYHKGDVRYLYLEGFLARKTATLW